MGQKFRDARGFRAMRMNLDATDEVMAPNEFREVYHCHEEGSTGRLVNMRGFENVMDLSVNSGFSMPGQMKCVGTTRDVESSTIIYFLMDTSGTAHSIMQMQVETKALTWILYNEPLLNFKNRLDSDVVEGLLYWTDGYFGSFLNNDFNPPRKINIAKAVKYTAAKASADCWQFEKIRPVAIDADTTGTTYLSTTTAAPYSAGDYIVPFALGGIGRNKKVTGHCQVLEVFQSGGYYGVVTTRPWQESDSSYHDVTGHVLPYEPDMYFGIDWQVMDVIKWKPQSDPLAEYETDSSITTNLLQNKLFQFAYRIVYDDNEKTVMSPISKVPIPSVAELLTGEYESNIVDNCIDIIVDTGPMEARSVEILARQGNDGVWGIVKRIYKYGIDETCEISSDIQYTYRFFNNEFVEPVDQANILRPYDFVPIVAKNQKVIEKNRVIYANYSEGFDRVDLNVSLVPDTVPVDLSRGNISVRYTLHGYPYTPADPPVGNHGWAQTVKWNNGGIVTNPQNPPPYTSPQTYGCLVLDMTNVPIHTGRLYILNFSAPNYRYTNSQNYQIAPYPEIFENDKVVATAIVSLLDGENLTDLLNKLATALRENSNSSDYGAIGFTAVPHGNYINHIWGDWTNQGESGNSDFNIGLKELGIVLMIGVGNNIDVSDIFITLDIVDDLYRYETLKSGEIKELGVEYSDRSGRVGFVNAPDSCSVYVPTQTESNPGGLIKSNVIRWELSHSPPDYATHWRWVMRKRVHVPYYIQVPVYNIDIAAQANSITGTFLAISAIQNFTVTKENYNKFNVPAYSWQRGDRMRFVSYGTKDEFGDSFKSMLYDLDFEILSVEIPEDTVGSGDTYLKDDLGNYITDSAGNKIKDSTLYKYIIPYFNYGTYGINGDDLENNKVIIEIYRKSKEHPDDIFYQISPTYDILNPNTTDRAHNGGQSNTISGWDRNQTNLLSARGVIDTGDAYIRQRFMMNDYFSAVFLVEDRSFSDWYDSDVISIGLPNIENRDAKHRVYPNNLRFGGKLIQDTRINEMSRFDGSDYYELPSKYGPIYKIEEVGDELKIIQKNHTSKILIGRAGVTQPNEEGTQIMSSTKDVLGTLLQTRWDFGTVHPGSFVKNGHKAYWFDFYAHSICRDPGNGIQNLTDLYGMKQFFIDRCRLFGTADNVDVTGGFDQQNEFVWWTFTDLTNSDNSFTIAYKDTGGRNEDGFVMLAQFLPDDYGESKMTMTAFKDNALWLMNSDNVPRCNFFGTQYKYWVTPVFNAQPTTVKRWLQILLSSPKRLSAPNAGDVSVSESGNSPDGMVSLLKPGAFTPIQGKYVADFGKNMLTTSLTPTLRDLVNGEDMEGKAIRVRLEGEETDEHKILAVEVEGVTTGV